VTKCLRCSRAVTTTNKRTGKPYIWCDACRKWKATYDKEYRSRPDVADKLRETGLQRRRKNVTKKADYDKARRADPHIGQKIRRKKREHYAQNREEIRERQNRRSLTPAGRLAIAASSTNRRARLKEAGTLTSQDIENVYVRHYTTFSSLTCEYCRMPITEDRPHHLDHVVPLAKGGANSVDNIRVVCAPCNLRKKALDLCVFLRRLPEYFRLDLRS